MFEKLLPHRRPADDETSDVIAKIFKQWRETKPDGTLREFWKAVAAGEVKLPGS
jgi:hypothetical protein